MKIADATKSGKFLYETKQHVNEYGASFSRLLPPGTILVAASGTLGYTQILGVQGCAHDGWLILRNLRDLDRDFAYYALKTLEQHFFNSGSGAAIQNINTDILRDAKIPYPPPNMQRRIAGILSGYDELIENSQRRIRILETMARALYREWFVNFRFPGHEKVRRVPSALGEIPEGWEVTTFCELYETSSGGTPSRQEPKYFLNGTIDWVKSQELQDGFVLSTEERITEEALRKSSAKIFPIDTVLIALYGATIGKLAILSGPAATNQACCAVLQKRPGFGREFAFLTLLLNRERIIGLRLGAAQQNISQALLKNLACLKPPNDLVREFTILIKPMLDVTLRLQRQIQNLRATRDLLLPRLLSGDMPLGISIAEAIPTNSVAAAPPLPTESIQYIRFPLQLEPLSVEDGRSAAARPCRPSEIDDIDRTDVLCAIRTLFSDDNERERDGAIRELAHALGYQRTGSRVYEVLGTDLLTAVRRGIIVNVGGVYRRGFRTLADCTRDSLKKDFESAIGRVWISREDAIRALAGWLGFARVGPVIEETGRSLINGLIREGRLKTDGPERIRRP